MIKPLIYAVALFPITCSGQTSMVETGVSVPMFLKVNADFTPRLKSSVIGATGIDFAIKVNGSDENSLSYLQLIGFMNDKRSFQIEPGSKIISEFYFININPSVLIKSKWDNMKFSFGIGGLINIGQDIGTSSSKNTSGNNYTNLDSSYQIIISNSRNIIPYISFGGVWDIRKHIKAQLLVQPTVHNFYEPGTKIEYKINNSEKEIQLSYLPVYFGLRLFYFFR